MRARAAAPAWPPPRAIAAALSLAGALFAGASVHAAAPVLPPAPATIRADYAHSGDALTEQYAAPAGQK